MITGLKRPLLILLVGAFVLIASKPARADVGYAPDSKAVPVIIGIVAVGVLIVYLVVRHGPSLTGCTSAGPGGMRIVNESNRRTYALSGDLDNIQAGERIRVKGKKKVAGNERQFAVTKVSKDFGACHSPGQIPLSPE